MCGSFFAYYLKNKILDTFFEFYLGSDPSNSRGDSEFKSDILISMAKVRLWYLYDFANSFASSVIIFYFPLLLLQGGASDTWIGISTAISASILLVLYPSLGRKSDKSQRVRMRYIQLSSLVMVVALFLIGFLTNLYAENYSLPFLFAVSILYIFFQISFQGSYVFYSSFMQNFEDTGHNKDSISGFGMGLGQLGNAVSIGVMGAFVVGGSLVWFGVSGKSLALILGGVIFITLASPFLFQKVGSPETRETKGTKFFQLSALFKKIIHNKRLFYYLLGYMLVADSVTTLQIYLTLYLKNVFKFTDAMSSLAGVISLGMLFATCMVLGSLAHKMVTKNKLLNIAGSIYVSTFLIFGLTPSIPFLAYLCLAFAGVAYGLFFPLARSLYSDIIPKKEQAEYFSFFIIFERTAAVIGPIIWVLVFILLDSYPIEFRYRANVLLLSVIAMAGLYLIIKSKNQSLPETPVYQPR